ncbi:O-antigen ligase-like membrane protein [Pseudokineococcus lusitanus]|uniref:O-antigen ligase-like membrane protein n=2 Tax=Pseudokineococcus lusitanus TaxID=763993 RepID=A0A3N1G922_9ACTN|nr:O-antigen ligase-like membrane protein [Pseudokineococcus lusitanus]
MVALVLLATSSLVWRIGGGGADADSVFALADRLVVPFVLFAVAPVVFADRAARDLLLRGLTCLGAYLAVTSVLELVAPAWVVPSYVVDPSLGIHVGRARGPFLSSEANGLVLVTCGAAACLLAGRRGGWRPLALVVAVLTPVALLLTLTRSVWLGALVGVVVASLQHPVLRRLLPVAAVAGLLVGGVILAAVPSLGAVAQERLTTTRSLDDRRNVNDAALRILEAHPLTGVGWGAFVRESHEWVRQADDYPVTNVRIEVHNVPLGRSAELGLPGGVLWVAVVLLGPFAAVALPVRRRPPGDADDDLPGWRLVLTAAAAAWGVAALVSPLTHPLPTLLVFVLAGVVLRDRLLGRPEPTAEEGPPPRQPPGGELISRSRRR